MGRKEDKDKEQEEKDKRRREQIVELHRTRLTHLKKAQQLMRDEHMALAVDSYTKYLGILALYFDTTEEKLSPKMFDQEKDITEMLLISIAYWDMAKTFDRNPNLQKDCTRCLDQFLKFSIGFKYQHVNAQIVRKFNNKKQAHNPKAFENAYQRIQISSKKCYIASACFGEDDYRTEVLRHFKLSIAPTEIGRDFIDLYYRISPGLVSFLERHSKLKFMVETFLIKPMLSLFIFFIRPHVTNKKTHH